MASITWKTGVGGDWGTVADNGPPTIGTTPTLTAAPFHPRAPDRLRPPAARSKRAT